MPPGVDFLSGAGALTDEHGTTHLVYASPIMLPNRACCNLSPPLTAVLLLRAPPFTFFHRLSSRFCRANQSAAPPDAHSCFC